MPKYIRPLRPDEIYHWGTKKDHKYIAKIGEGKDARYFYSQAELDMYRLGQKVKSGANNFYKKHISGEAHLENVNRIDRAIPKYDKYAQRQKELGDKKIKEYSNHTRIDEYKERRSIKKEAKKYYSHAEDAERAIRKMRYERIDSAKKYSHSVRGLIDKLTGRSFKEALDMNFEKSKKTPNRDTKSKERPKPKSTNDTNKREEGPKTNVVKRENRPVSRKKYITDSSKLVRKRKKV